MVWFATGEDYVDEAFGSPCSVIIRHYEMKRQNFDDTVMIAKKKK